MTVAEILDYYANLLIIQYHGKSKAVATIKALLEPLIMNKIAFDVRDGFDMETAVGVQLDKLGKYLDVSRTGFGINGQPITLDDTSFKSLLKFAAISNSNGTSLSDITTSIFSTFPNQVIAYDNGSMNMSYFINSTLGSSDLVEMLITQNLLPKPMTVSLASVIFAPVIDSFFGFRTYELDNLAIKPFNNYVGYDMTWPWLSYTDALI